MVPHRGVPRSTQTVRVALHSIEARKQQRKELFQFHVQWAQIHLVRGGKINRVQVLERVFLLPYPHGLPAELRAAHQRRLHAVVPERRLERLESSFSVSYGVRSQR